MIPIEPMRVLGSNLRAFLAKEDALPGPTWGLERWSVDLLWLLSGYNGQSERKEELELHKSIKEQTFDRLVALHEEYPEVSVCMIPEAGYGIEIVLAAEAGFKHVFAYDKEWKCKKFVEQYVKPLYPDCSITYSTHDSDSNVLAQPDGSSVIILCVTDTDIGKRYKHVARSVRIISDRKTGEVYEERSEL